MGVLLKVLPDPTSNLDVVGWRASGVLPAVAPARTRYCARQGTQRAV